MKVIRKNDNRTIRKGDILKLVRVQVGSFYSPSGRNGNKLGESFQRKMVHVIYIWH